MSAISPSCHRKARSPELPTTWPALLMARAKDSSPARRVPRSVIVPPCHRKAWASCPGPAGSGRVVAAQPTIWPASLRATASLLVPPSVGMAVVTPFSQKKLTLPLRQPPTLEHWSPITWPRSLRSRLTACRPPTGGSRSTTVVTPWSHRNPRKSLSGVPGPMPTTWPASLRSVGRLTSPSGVRCPFCHRAPPPGTASRTWPASFTRRAASRTSPPRSVTVPSTAHSTACRLPDSSSSPTTWPLSLMSKAWLGPGFVPPRSVTVPLRHTNPWRTPETVMPEPTISPRSFMSATAEIPPPRDSEPMSV